MDFSLTEEQRQLQDAVSRFMSREYTFDRRRTILESGDGCNADVWRALAGLGVLAVGVPETLGGLGGSAIDTMIVMQEFGRGLLLEPYVPTVVIGADSIAQAGSAIQRDELLPQIMGGEQLLAWAHEEPGNRYNFDCVTTKATRVGGGVRIDGRKSVVVHAAAAQHLLVSAREHGDERSPHGVSLFVVPRAASGVSLSPYATHDGARAADVVLNDVRVNKSCRLGEPGRAHALIVRAHERAIAAVCAEAVGAMSALVEITAEYLKTRKQFGVPIGSFQALQHRMADMLMRLEQARSMAFLAASSLASTDSSARARSISAAKSLVGRAARFVGQQAVQLHGGIGVTDEVNVSHYFKRLTVIDTSFGDSAHHLARYSDAMVSDSAVT